MEGGCHRHCRYLCRLLCVLLQLLLSRGQTLTNVALHKPATQSTFHPTYGQPQKAVDGNRGTVLTLCTHTADTDPNPERWWRVDLQGMYEVHAVIVTNRGDCCGFRLANFRILVSRSLSDPSQGWQDSSALCVYRGPQIANGATERLNCSQPIAGRYVTLLITSTTEPMNFCELEVLARPVTLVYRTGVYRTRKDHKAPGDIIETYYVRGVIQCTSACTMEPDCTAVNLHKLEDGSREIRRVCELWHMEVSTA